MQPNNLINLFQNEYKINMNKSIETLWLNNQLSLASIRELSMDEVAEFLSFLKYKIEKTRVLGKKFSYHCLFALIHSYATMDEEDFKQVYNEIIGNILHSESVDTKVRKQLTIDLVNVEKSRYDEVFLPIILN